MNKKYFIVPPTVEITKIKNHRLQDNQKFYIKIILIFSLTLSLFALYTPDAYCSGLGKLSGTLKTKIEDVTKVVDGIAKAGVGLGLLWFIISLIRGEPQYRYAFLLVLAGCLLYTASHITQWAIGT